MEANPLRKQLEDLDHRRARVEEILISEPISAELRRRLMFSLQETQRKIAMLKADSSATESYAANA
jgi:hypothetical protein